MPVTVQAGFGENGRCAASDWFGHWFHDDADSVHSSAGSHRQHGRPHYCPPG
jgi:hypothetical protein